MDKFLATRRVYILGLVLGLLQGLVFDFESGTDYGWLAALLSIVSVGGFLYVIMHLSPKRARWFAYLFGLSAFGWGLNWVYISMATYGNAPLSFAIAANALVAAYLALYWLVAAYLITKGRSPNQRLLLAPAVIALLEWLRSVFLVGFPWLSMGYGFVDTAFAQYASLVGVFGVSFLLVLFVALPLMQICTSRRVALLVMVLVLGIVAPRYLPTTTKGASTRVALIQGNMPVITDYNSEVMSKNLVQYHLLTEKSFKESPKEKQPDVIIWPESAIPFFYVEAKEFLDDIYAMQLDHSFDLITGVPRYNWSDKSVYNSVLLQPRTQASTQPPQLYDKAHLLPFGEYLPFRSLFSFFKNFVTIQMADFTAGKSKQLPLKAGGIQFAPSICYEAVFGDEIRRNAQSAEVLLNVSNDAWFGDSKLQRQHLNIARMRAIENQKMLVRATNDGRTAIVSARGEMLKSLPSYTEGVLQATVFAHSGNTWYARFGDKLIITLAILWLLGVIIGCRLYRRPHSSELISKQINNKNSIQKTFYSLF